MNSQAFAARILAAFITVLIVACAPAPTPVPTRTPAPPPALSTITPAQPTPLPVPTSGFSEATPETALALRGRFVYSAGDGSLWIQEAQGGEPRTLVERSKEAIAQQPAFSTDGKTVAYSALLFESNGDLRGDLRAIEMDGGKVRTLVNAETNDTVYFYPRFAPDGRLLVTHAEHLQTTNERAWLEWVNLRENGAHTRLIDNARDGDVSGDGRLVAFVRTDPATQASSLWTVHADGTNPTQLADDQTFLAIVNPRFSPDGKWLAFGVHGAPSKRLPLVTNTFPHAENSCALTVLFFCFAERAFAHVAPGALWRVNLETGKFQPLTDVYDDSPVPAWAPESTAIAIHDYTGLRLIDLNRRKIYPLFLEDGGNGGFDWTPF